LLDAEGTRLVIKAVEAAGASPELPAYGIIDPTRSTAPVINHAFATAEPSGPTALHPPERALDRQAEAGI